MGLLFAVLSPYILLFCSILVAGLSKGVKMGETAGILLMNKQIKYLTTVFNVEVSLLPKLVSYQILSGEYANDLVSNIEERCLPRSSF